MNCDLCEKHILATMQVNWNGGNYHADCIGEVLAQNRAKNEPSPEEMIEVKEALDEFEDEFPNGIPRVLRKMTFKTFSKKRKPFNLKSNRLRIMLVT